MKNRKTDFLCGWLTVNRNCNNRCGWCYMKDVGFKGKDMPIDLAKKLLLLMKDIGIPRITILGGEPTLYEPLPDVVTFARSLGQKVSMSSNGRRFSNAAYLKKLMGTGIENCSVSLKAGNREQYKKLTGRFGYNETVRGIRNMKKLLGFVNATITISKGIEDNLEEMIANHVEAGVSRFTIDTASPPIEGAGVSGKNTLNPFELSRMISRAYKELEKHDVTYSFNVAMPLCLLDKKMKTKMLEKNQVFNSCHIPSGVGLVFGNEGHVLPCNHFPSHPHGKYGVDFDDKESFLEFWHSKGLHEFRLACNKYPHEKCKTCEDWNICSGGCMLKWLCYDPADYIGRRE